MYNKDNREYYKKIGICTRCHKEKSEQGKTLCLQCKMYQRQFKKKYDPNKQKIIDAEKRAYRKENNLCVNCGKRKQEHGLLCNKCYSTILRRKTRNKADITRSERPAYGICYTCGKYPVLTGKKVCKDCYNKRIISISKIMYMTRSEKNVENFKY